VRKEDVALAVLEATGGLLSARRGARPGREAGGEFVNPRQLRDVRPLATGKLARETDRIDACVLAHFAEALRPQSHAPWPRRARPRTLGRGTQEAPDPGHEDRRGQSRARTPPKALRKRIEAHLRWLSRKENWRVSRRRAGAGREGEPLVWKERADLLMSVPGVGPTLSATLLAELAEPEHLVRNQATSCGMARCSS
jgi:transposase